jgi:hypothetical protein
MPIRKCFVLTGNQYSERAQFSKNILEKIGFIVKFVNFIPYENKVLSNKISMQYIYGLIATGNHEWTYVFEDDINILQDITIDEIIEYEKISSKFFYLGACMTDGERKISLNTNKINNYDVTTTYGNVRGLHAIALSKHGAQELLFFSHKLSNYEYMDMILEKFAEINPANIVRYDLESYLEGHKGIFFQDRNKFPSTI